MKIHPTLQRSAVPISSLVLASRNPRKGDLVRLRESLRTNGQYRPIVVRKGTNEVLAGNHTTMAAQAEGWEKIAAVFVEVDDNEAKRILLVDNRTADVAGYDDPMLEELLGELSALDEGLVGTGYEDSDLVNLRVLLASLGKAPTDPNEEWEGMPDFSQPHNRWVYKVVVKFFTHDDADAFFEMLGRQRSAQIWWPQGDEHVGSSVKEALYSE